MFIGLNITKTYKPSSFATIKALLRDKGSSLHKIHINSKSELKLNLMRIIKVQ